MDLPNARPLGRYVNQWLHHNGEYPGDEAVMITMQNMVKQWREERDSGLDVLAICSIDDMAELVEAMRDLI